MSTSPFGHSKRQQRPQLRRSLQPKLDEITLDDFSGGLNLIDNDLKITSIYAKVLNNMNRGLDGTMSKRRGFKFKWNLPIAMAGDGIEMEFFRDKILNFSEAGNIITTDQAGNMTTIWDAAIAAALPGAPAGWSSGLTLIDTTEFRNELIVCNGVDKPLLIQADHDVAYLQDIPTGSNINTPISKYCTTVGNYVVMAGIATAPYDIYISAAGASGTWPGDPAPNDAVSFNITAYAPETGGEVRGLSSFRNMLVVHFAAVSIVIVLGEYSGAVHKPRVLDTIASVGVINHRTTVTIGNYLIIADDQGIHRASRNSLGTTVDARKLSDLIQPLYINAVPTTTFARRNTYALHNKLERRILFFMQKGLGLSYDVISMSYDEEVKSFAFSYYPDWSFMYDGVCAWGNRLYIADGTKIYQIGNDVYEGEDYAADFIDYYLVVWSDIGPGGVWIVGNRVLAPDGLVYVCIVPHTAGATFADDLALEYWEPYQGEDIEFDWEFPWADVNRRMRKKRIGFIGLNTYGSATFEFQIYTDNARTDKQTGADTPALTMTFRGGDSDGYGVAGDQPYGGGRRTADERMWGFPCEFKIAKLRIKGASKKPLSFSMITLLYRLGTFKR